MSESYKRFGKKKTDFTSHTNRKVFWQSMILKAILYLTATLPTIVVFFSIYSLGYVPNELPMSGIVALALSGIGALYGLMSLSPSNVITRRSKVYCYGGLHWGFIFLCLTSQVVGLAIFILLLLPPTIFYP